MADSPISRTLARNTQAITTAAKLTYSGDSPAERDKMSHGVRVFVPAGGANIYVGLGSAPTATEMEQIILAGAYADIEVTAGVDIWLLSSGASVTVSYRQYFVKDSS